MLGRMILSGIAALAAVVASPGQLGAPAPAPTPIYGGEVVAPGAFPAVVAISVGNFLCTGTLVSSNVIFTAAHCLDGGPPADSIVVRFGDDVNQPLAPTASVVAYGSHPEFCPDEECKEDIEDYGFLVLAQPQAGPFPRVLTAQDEWDELMQVDAPVTLVGYGKTESGDVTGIKRQVEVTITRFSGSGQEFQAGGDGLDSCQGDSGGPAFARTAAGEYVLVGITSRGYTCGKGGFYAVPFAGLCWLQEASGLDLRPPDCEACDCLDTDPDRGGCGCRGADAPRLGLLVAALAWRRRRR
jgi:MYXO-CTERM domain-containing protein